MPIIQVVSSLNPVHQSNAAWDSIQRGDENMMGKSMKDLEWLLDYELCAARRYRRFLTLVFVTSSGSPVAVKDLLSDSVRDSDVLFDLQSGGTAILMGETRSDGALEAVSRYKAKCANKIDLRFSLASYPNDGQGPAELLETGFRRLSLATEQGAVVTQG